MTNVPSLMLTMTAFIVTYWCDECGHPNRLSDGDHTLGGCGAWDGLAILPPCLLSKPLKERRREPNLTHCLTQWFALGEVKGKKLGPYF